MTMIPYGRQSVGEDDIQAVVEVLRSDLITQGPVSVQFEKAIAEYCGACYAVAVANGTAALHLAAMAGGFGPGDEVVTSPMTFVASPNCALYCGARPVFADIDAKTYCIDVKQIRKQLTSATRGIIPVHFAGQPCDMAAIFDIARERELIVIEDDKKTLYFQAKPQSGRGALFEEKIWHRGNTVTSGRKYLFRAHVLMPKGAQNHVWDKSIKGFPLSKQQPIPRILSTTRQSIARLYAHRYQHILNLPKKHC